MTIVCVALVGMPFAYGILATPEGMTYSGMHNSNSGDHGIYFSQMEQAASGKLLFYNLYTSESHDPIIFNPVWLVLGLLSRLTGISVPIMFHLCRLLLIPFFAFTAWKFASLLFAERRARTISFALIMFAGGWWGYAAATDASPYHAMLFSPHLILSSSALLWVFMLFLQAMRKGLHSNAIAAGVVACLLILFHPYQASTIALVLVLFGLWGVFSRKASLVRVVSAVGWVGLLSFPAVAYYVWLFRSLPFGRVWLFQSDSLNLMDNPLRLLFSFLPIVCFAGFGSVLLWKSKHPYARFLITWLVIPIVFMPLPVFFRMRMSGGWLIPLACAAGVALSWAWERTKKLMPVYVRVGAAICVGVLFFWANGVMTVVSLSVFVERLPQVYLPNDQVALNVWIRTHVQEREPILASWRISNLLPGLTGRTVYMGHGVQTADADRKVQQAEWFFSSRGLVSEKQDFLQSAGIAYVVTTPLDPEVGSFRPESISLLHKEFQAGGYAVYSVR